MPIETKDAVNWALKQTYDDGFGNQVPVTKDTPQALVDHVRQYFNDNGIAYNTFNYDDLIPFLN